MEYDASKNPLFDPIAFGRLTVKNRIAIAPHGSGLHERDGSIGDKMLYYLRNQARGGAGMLTIGSGDIGPDWAGVSIGHPADPALIGNYYNAAEMAHQYDCKISMQLIPGREMLMPTEQVVNSYTKDDISVWQDQYVNAACNLMQAGFDFIMIHGAHGNGPAMFYSPRYNHRTDEYGGSEENRARFGVEVLEKIRARCGDKLHIEYRLSADEIDPEGASIEETIAYAKRIEDLIDLLHISRGVLEDDRHLPYIFTPTYFEHAINLQYAARFKEALSVPVTVVGGFNLDLAAKAIEEGKVDMVSMCRTMMADPSCVRKYRENRADEIRPCVRCNTCIAQVHERLWDLRCAVNPSIGRETQHVQFPRCGKKKKVLLAGGGPANLQAARTLSERGHQVILCEKNDELGGNLRYASAAPFKQDLRKYLDWRIRMVEKDDNIELRYGVEVDADYVKRENPDVLFIGTGSTPIIPNFSAAGTDRLLWAGDVLTGKKRTGDQVVIAGSGFTGLETALFLANEGRKVTVVDMLPAERIGADAPQMSMIGLKKMLSDRHVTFVNEIRVEDVDEQGLHYSVLKDGSKGMIECDTVVLSLGMRKDLRTVKELGGIIDETYVIGDCSPAGGLLWHAVRAGYDMAMEVG